jgi:hypothetical protein
MGYYERRLPHWHPEQAAIFVTWRLHGSLPRSYCARPGQPSGKAFVEMDRALAAAAAGPTWLKDERIARCLVETLQFGEEQLRLYVLRAWSLMSNHVHVLIEPRADIPRITRSIKSYPRSALTRFLGGRASRSGKMSHMTIGCAIKRNLEG